MPHSISSALHHQKMYLQSLVSKKSCPRSERGQLPYTPSLAQLREQMQNLIARPHEPQKLLVSNHRFKVRHRYHRSAMHHAISKQHIATHCEPKLLRAKPLLQIGNRILIQWKRTPSLQESYSERQCPAHTAPSGIQNSYSIQRDYALLSCAKPTDSRHNGNTECA